MAETPVGTEAPPAPASPIDPGTAATSRPPRDRPLGWLPIIAVLVGVGLCICCAADLLSRATQAPTPWILWAGVAVIVVPVVYRLCSADASMAERIAIVLLFGLALYVVKLMRDPFGYTMGDEFFHAHNAQQIVSRHALFGSNSLLPVTTRYPGLEGATSALMTMTGMSSFGAGLIVIGAARVTLMLGLMTLFFAVSRSWRIAALGAAAYAGNSNFLLWGAQFSYESLALPLLVVVLACVAERARAPKTEQPAWAIPILIGIAAVTVTHHLTSYLLALLLVLIGLLPLVRRWQIADFHVRPFAAAALVAVVAWLVVVASSTVGYISPVVSHAFTQTIHTIVGESSPRAPFQGPSTGTVTPVLDRVAAFAALALLAGGLVLGLPVVWRRYRRNPVALVLWLCALGFFAVLGLRLSPSAWEIGNRTGEFLFIGLAFVVASAVVSRLLVGGRWAAPVIAAAAGVVVIGGAITGWPSDAVLAAPVRVATGRHRIDSETVAVGRWVGAHLPDASFGATEADARTILLYGGARVLTGPSAVPIVTSTVLQSWQLPSLGQHGLAYVVLDTRQRGNDSTRGYRFSLRPPGGPFDPLFEPAIFAKFGNLLAPRVYDSGHVVIYDVRGVLQ